MTDGLYQVTTGYLCAAFVIEDGAVVACAPILRGKLDYWKTVSRKVSGSLDYDRSGTQARPGQLASRSCNPHRQQGR